MEGKKLIEISIYQKEGKIFARLLMFLNKQEFSKYLVTHRELGFKFNRNSKSMEYVHNKSSNVNFDEFVESYISNLSNLFGESSLNIKRF